MGERSLPLPLAGKIVLVCEDSPLIALDCEALLIELGASVVHTAGTLSEARRKIDANLDLAVLDWGVHGENTLAIAQELHRRYIPLVLVSAYTDIRQVAERFTGAQAISKPYSLEALSDACRSALQSSSASGNINCLSC